MLIEGPTAHHKARTQCVAVASVRLVSLGHYEGAPWRRETSCRRAGPAGMQRRASSYLRSREAERCVRGATGTRQAQLRLAGTAGLGRLPPDLGSHASVWTAPSSRLENRRGRQGGGSYNHNRGKLRILIHRVLSPQETRGQTWSDLVSLRLLPSHKRHPVGHHSRSSSSHSTRASATVHC